ncbi:hypothetical protein ACOME3_002950 [Neoechinorhynchus agilis]
MKRVVYQQTTKLRLQMASFRGSHPGLLTSIRQVETMLNHLRRSERALLFGSSSLDSPIEQISARLENIRQNLLIRRRLDDLEYQDGLFHLFSPFLVIVRSSQVNGHLTYVALSCIEKLLTCPFVAYHVNYGRNQSLLNKICTSVTRAKFDGTDNVTDEVILMKIVMVLRILIINDREFKLNEMSIDNVREIVQSCFRVCFEPKLSELLRRTTRHVLEEIVRRLFSRNRVLQRRFSHPCINVQFEPPDDTLLFLNELILFLSSIINPHDPKNTVLMTSVGLELLEESIRTGCESGIMQSCRSLGKHLKTNTCLTFAYLLTTTNSESFFSSVLNVIVILLDAFRFRFIAEFEYLIVKLFKVLMKYRLMLDSGPLITMNTSASAKTSILKLFSYSGVPEPVTDDLNDIQVKAEHILSFIAVLCALPNAMDLMFANYDCQYERVNLFEVMVTCLGEETVILVVFIQWPLKLILSVVNSNNFSFFSI